MRIEGLVILGPPTAFMGDLAGGIAQFDRAIALFDPDRHGRGALRVGPNPVVVAHSVGALFLWMSGYPDTAQRRSAASIALAERLGHPYSLAYAVFHAAMLDLWSGRIDAAGEHARRVVQIAAEREYARLARERPHRRGRDGRGAGPPRRGARADRPGPRALREPPHAAGLLAADPRPPGTGAGARRPRRGSAGRGHGGVARRRPGRHVRPDRAAPRPGRPAARVGRRRRGRGVPRGCAGEGALDRGADTRARRHPAARAARRGVTGATGRRASRSTTPSPKASRPLPCGTPAPG